MNRSDYLIVTISFLCFVLLHLVVFPHFHGLHYDEAWAGLYAHRIAFEPGFWPIAAMSPYTAPWAHYWTAIWFKALGSSLWVFRMSHILLTAVGVTLITQAVAKTNRTAAVVFIWLSIFTPVIFFNARFAIELTGFHVFCLGLLIWALQNRWFGVAAVAAFLGITAHVLFVAPCLAVLGSVGLAGKRIEGRSKQYLIALLVALVPFYLSAAMQMPKPGKPIALIILSFVLLIWIFCQNQITPRLHKYRKIFLLLFGVVAVPFAGNIALFIDGHWQIAQRIGLIHFPWLIGWAAIWLGFWLFISKTEGNRLPKEWTYWVIICVPLVGSIVLKQSPRYYQIAILGSLAYLSLWLSGKRFFLAAVGYAVTAMLVIQTNYINPLKQNAVVAKKVHFLFLHDHSRDFLPKLPLVLELARSSCKASDVITADLRLRTALDFLALGDWPSVDQIVCLYGKVRVERKEYGKPNTKQWRDLGHFFMEPYR